MNNTRNYSKNIKIVVGASVSVLLVTVALSFAATHGIIRLSETSAGDEYLLSRVGEQEIQNISSASWKIVPNGSYTLSYKNDDGHAIKNIDVPNFLRSVDASIDKITQKQVYRVAGDVLTNVARGVDGQVVSVNTIGQTGSLLVHPTDDPTGIRATVEALPPSVLQAVINNKLVAFDSVSDDNYGLVPTVFDFSTGKTTRADKEYTGESIANIVSPSVANTTKYGIYTTDGPREFLDVFNENVQLSSFNDLTGVAFGSGENNPKIIGISNSFVAIGFGDDFSGTPIDYVRPESYQQPKATRDFIVKLYDITTAKEVDTINLGKTNTISSIQIPDSGNTLSVVDNNTLKVFDLESDKQLYSYQIANIITPQWLDDNRLVFASSANGMYELNVQKKTAATLFALGKLQISSFVVNGDEILFRAYSSLDTSGSAIPDGYSLKLDTPASDGNTLIQSTPYVGDTFKITSLNGAIYAAAYSDEPVSRVDEFGDFIGPEFRVIAADDSLKGAVKGYLEENIPDYQQYTIIYGLNL